MRNIKQEKFLKELYEQFDATTPIQKYNVLVEALEKVYSKIYGNSNLSIEENVSVLEERVLDLDGIRQSLR